jgi:plasmid stabilization system protein ParE
VNQTYRVLWDNEAKASLKAIVAYIRKDSPAAAQKVKQALLRLAASLKQLPDRFSTEPYLEGRALPGGKSWQLPFCNQVAVQDHLPGNGAGGLYPGHLSYQQEPH